jgi:phage anti-repressor protein
MKKIINVIKSPTTGNPIVNARELYNFLEVTKNFSNWIKEKIKRWEFVENEDYARIFYDVSGKVLKISHDKNGRMEECGFANLIYKIEYALTIDCAKEISMVQNNDKGREARKYFIAVEKEWKILKQLPQTTIQLKNLGFKEAGKFYNTSGKQVNKVLKTGRYLRPNGSPYEKHILKGYFAWEFYDERFTRKHVTLTPNKGMPLLGKLLGKAINLPTTLKSSNLNSVVPAIIEQSPVPQISANLIEIILENDKVNYATNKEEVVIVYIPVEVYPNVGVAPKVLCNTLTVGADVPD